MASSIRSNKEVRVIEQILNNFSYSQDISRYKNYVLGKDSSLIRDLCTVREALPSHGFFEYLHENEDRKNAKNILSDGINLARRFYTEIFSLGFEAKDDFQEFSTIFHKNIQPLGKKIIITLQLVKACKKELILKSSSNFF